MKISGNTVLITGGATGIGYELAEHFLSGGSTVIICGRRKDRLDEAKKKLPGLHTRVADVSNEGERERLRDWTLSGFPGLNVIVNNAGIQRTINLTTGMSDMKAGNDEIKINLEAPIVLCGLFIPHLLKQTAPAIINVSSGLGFVPIARFPIYCATKAAIHSYTLSLRYQLQKSGVKVFEVVPPAVDTELNTQGSTAKNTRHFGLSADEFVTAVMKGLSEDVEEIGYGMTEDLKKASREDLDKRFIAMNRYRDEQFSI